MEMTPHIDALRADLAAAAGVGDETAMRVAEQLGRALEPALRLRLLDILSEAALELNGQLPHGQIDLRIAGRDAMLTYGEGGGAAAAPPPDDEQAARITLRLPETLKTRAESAAAAEGVSLNTWLVKVTARALDRGRGGPGKRLTGFAKG
jgi:HicB-like protein involved in pilus formation